MSGGLGIGAAAARGGAGVGDPKNNGRELAVEALLDMHVGGPSHRVKKIKVSLLSSQWKKGKGLRGVFSSFFASCIVGFSGIDFCNTIYLTPQLTPSSSSFLPDPK